MFKFFEFIFSLFKKTKPVTTNTVVTPKVEEKKVMLPRGIRNNNPGNINYVGQKGARMEPVTSGIPNPRFAKFDTPEGGIACLRDQLIRDYTVHNLKTVTAIIGSWAPPSENNTRAYIAGVAHSVGLEPDAPIATLTPTILTGLMNAIIRYENGYNPYGDLVRQVVSKDTALA